MGDAPPFDQEDFYVITPIMAINEMIGMPFEVAIDVIHRPQCTLISHFAHWQDATEADQQAGTWQDDFCFIDRSHPEPKVVYYTGTPFEVLCQMYRHDRVTWFHMTFCPECNGLDEETVGEPVREFLSMMPDDDFKDVLSELADIIGGAEIGHTCLLHAEMVAREAVKRIGVDFFPPMFR